MELFTLGYKDYTRNILLPTYTINLEPVSETWTDANGRLHSTTFRTKISGSFTMQFDSLTDYYNFMQELQAVRSDEENYYTVSSLYITNRNYLATNVDMIINMTPVLNPKARGGIEALTVTLEEV